MSSRRSIGNTFHVTTVTDGTNGTNAFSADLSNEMDSVACDSDMKTAAAFNIYSQIAAFYGVEDVTALCQIRYTSKPTNASLTLETSGSGTGSTSLTTTFQTISTKQWIRIHYNSGVAVSKRETLEVEIKHATYGTIALSIAVVGMKGGAIYNLVPSANAITNKKDGTYTPNVITCGSSKLDVATGTTSSNPSEATIKYSADGGSVANYPSGGLTAGTNFSNYVTFFLYVNNTVVDKETVNIVTDGLDGAEGKGYKLFLTRNGLYTDAKWNNYGTIGASVSWGKQSGDPDFLICRVGDLFVVSGISNDSEISHTATYKCTAVSSELITGTCITHTHDGNAGSRGKAGRFYYFAGDWNALDSYVMTDTQAPYVKRGSSFYMLDNAGNGGTNVTSTNQDPSNASYGNGKPWTAMMSDMKYYIAQAFFGNYAHFGSFIINGDWMVSQKGTLGGVYSEDYEKFDPAYPTVSVKTIHTVNGESWYDYNFVPNFAVDGKAGFLQSVSGNIGGFEITNNGIMYNGGTYLTSIAQNGIYLLHSTFTIENSELKVDDGFANLQCGIIKKVREIKRTDSLKNIRETDSVVIFNTDEDASYTAHLPSNPAEGQELWLRSNSTGLEITISATGGHKIQYEGDPSHIVDSFKITTPQKWYHGIFFGTWKF